MSNNILQHPQFDAIAGQYEDSLGLPKGLLRSVAIQESGGRNVAAANGDGGMGVFQFTDPSVIKHYNVDPKDPWDSLRAAAEYLGDGVKKYGKVEAALADFHRGPKAAQRVARGESIGNGPIESKYIPSVLGRLPKDASQAVTNTLAAGDSASIALPALRKAGYNEWIDDALSKGATADEIVQILAPEAAKLGKDVAGQSFGANVVEGAGNAVSDAALGAKQALTTDPANAAALQEEARRRQADPRRQAIGETAGGMTGNVAVKAAPAVVAGVATGGAGLLPMIAGQAAAGALTGAVEPTTEQGQRTGNVVRDAALGGGTAGVLAGGAKLMTGAAAKALRPNASVVAERQALADTARAQGLPVNAASLTNTGKNIVASMPDDAAVKAAQTSVDDALTEKVANGLGITDWKSAGTGAIDHELVNAAKGRISQALDDAADIDVRLSRKFASDLDQLKGKYSNPLTDGISTTPTVTKAIDNIQAAAAAGTKIPGKQLQMLMSELKEVVQTQGASNAEKRIASEVITSLETAFKQSMSKAQFDAFKAANKQYANMKAVEKMVSLSNDTGVVSPRQMIQAVKTGRFKNQFNRGEAPYQELAKTAAEMYGPAAGRGLPEIVKKAAGMGDTAFGAAAIVNPVVGIPAWVAKKAAQKLMAKGATSTNPTVVRLLTGIDGGVRPIDATTKAYIKKALAGAGGAIGTS
jgi:hypothetical protein